MKVLVAGAGAVGCWLGARLAKAGRDVTLLGRPALQDTVEATGLHVTGHTAFEGRIPVITAPGGGPYDAVFVTCKAHQTATLAPDVAPLLADDGAIVTFQNGLGNAEVLMSLVPAEQVAVALNSHGIMVEAPGRIRHAGTGTVRVGPAPGQPPGRADALAAGLLDDAGLEPERVGDAVGHMWLKAAVNAGINPLCALHGIRNGDLRDHWEEAVALVEEVVALSRAAGVHLPADAVEALTKTVEGTAENRCSMLQDVEARRPTEVEQITGYFVRVARRLGYPLPQNEAVLRRIKVSEETYLGREAAMATTRRAAEAFRW